MLQFKDFKKSYGSFQALSIADFKVEQGLYWLKGVNGSGKSTLLKSIAGILSFDGDIILNGSINQKKEPVLYRQLVSFAEAEPLFPEFLTGRELIRLFAEARKAEKGQEQPYIESMQMQSYVDRPIGSYSSGMNKKLSLLLAFLGHPKLILLDEPLITIDTASLEILYSWINQRRQQEGTGFILSSHQSLDDATLPKTGELLIQNHTLQNLDV
ncbi:ABC transporter ATP-binding protein [Mucilaginibacter sp. RS28]|uniref:ABC transporter ATP-binding protein n=1 Tax=Mucilaginibacter straminoryzae TaxID=2932774 RepID=A0A9X2B8F2_9SPHI|nr:ABC transporter ATP-binding protein [Mucilaginibacter straminoryzae]MCJ8209549.1 ABC transporter ATP-binding protein [Mucilaginibacter straminoryzae]